MLLEWEVLYLGPPLMDIQCRAQCQALPPPDGPMADKEIDSFDALGAAKRFKLAHLNVHSLPKKIDQIRTMLHGSGIDILSISETWMRPHLNSKLVALQGFDTYRLDRGGKNMTKKRGGGLLLYVNKRHSSLCESLEDMNESNEHVEMQWIIIHRPHCKNVVICNLYRPPAGDLSKALKYLDDCLKTVNNGWRLECGL